MIIGTHGGESKMEWTAFGQHLVGDLHAKARFDEIQKFGEYDTFIGVLDVGCSCGGSSERGQSVTIK